MGRPGTGGGGRSRSGGGGSRSGRSGGRSGRVGGGGSPSFSRSSRPSGGYGGGYSRGPAPAPRPPRPPRHYGYNSRPRTRTVYRNGGGSSSGCSTVFAWIIVLIIVFAVLGSRGYMNFGGSGNSYASNTIDVDVLAENAETYYNENVMIPNGNTNDEKAFLFYYTYLEEADADQYYYLPGYDVDHVFTDSVYDAFDKAYSNHYNDSSVGAWLSGIFEDTANVVAKSGKVDNPSRFNEECVYDDLDWMSNAEQNQVVESCEEFFEKTGVQPYIVLVDYSELPGVVISKGNNNTVLKTLIIAVAVIVVVVLLIGWWKKVQARKKEEQEATERMLNTPLEKFGDTGDTALNDLIDKYDDDGDN